MIWRYGNVVVVAVQRSLVLYPEGVLPLVSFACSSLRSFPKIGRKKDLLSAHFCYIESAGFLPVQFLGKY